MEFVISVQEVIIKTNSTLAHNVLTTPILLQVPRNVNIAQLLIMPHLDQPLALVYYFSFPQILIKLDCIQNCETCNDALTCNSCQAGYYKNGAKGCISCPTDTWSWGGTISNCDDCPVGQFAPEGSDSCYSINFYQRNKTAQFF